MPDQNNILNLTSTLIKSLLSDGMTEDAIYIQDLIENRDIWDRMIVHLKNKIDLLLSSGKLKDKAKRIALDLKDALALSSTFLEHPVYGYVKQVVDKLRENELPDWAKRLEDAITSGSTGTEICMAIRWNLLHLIDNSSVTITPELRDMVNKAIKRLNDVLR